MAFRPWFVQTQNDEGQFVTVEGGEHNNFYDAYWHYDKVTDEPGVHMLLRGSYILLRSDTVELDAERPADSLL